MNHDSVYWRALSGPEASVIQDTAAIPANREQWRTEPEGPDYAVGSVVFLVRSDRAMALQCLQERVQSIIDEGGTAFILKLCGALEVEEDRSGWKLAGAVVHLGPIELAGLEWELTPVEGLAAVDQLWRRG